MVAFTTRLSTRVILLELYSTKLVLARSFVRGRSWSFVVGFTTNERPWILSKSNAGAGKGAISATWLSAKQRSTHGSIRTTFYVYVALSLSFDK